MIAIDRINAAWPMVALILASMILGSTPSTALGEGGKSIAGATGVVLGQQEFGNTQNGAQEPRSSSFFCGNTNYRSWWQLPAVTGDKFTIDWESSSPDMHMVLFSVGVTDYTFNGADRLVDQTPNSNLKSESIIVAPTSGMMPLEFGQCTGTPGPYNFTVYVNHAVVLALPRLSRLTRRSVINVAVHNPEGGVISDPQLFVDIQLRRGNGRWKTYGTSSVVNSAANVQLHLPRTLRKHKVSMRAFAHGVGFTDKTSATAKSVRVTQ